MSTPHPWDERYASTDYVFGTAPNAFVVEQAHRLPSGAHVLAVADGEGRNGVWLAEQGHAVTSIDISRQGQAKAARLAAKRRVELDFRIADLADWPWPTDCYDAVVAIFIQFAEPALRDAIFVNMRRATRPGGRILLQGYRPEQVQYGTGGPPCSENMYTAAMLRAAFAGWNIEHLEEHDSVLSEGTGHSGMSALVDMVARKPS
jgi:SAM-dependent methyltransferase